MNTAEPRYPFVHVRVQEDLADEVSALLFELGATGVEQRDATTLAKGDADRVVLVASFETHEEALEAIESLDVELAPTLEEVVGDAWRDAWKEHFHPFAITATVTVRPPWEAYEPTRPGEKVLELEPGRAFGTGLHATTSLVARALEASRDEVAGARVLDVGTGSGILALVALTLGARTVVAIDNDPDAIEVTRENAARNGLEARVESSITPVEELTERFPVVIANIEARVLIPLAAPVAARVAPGGKLVLSGILVGQEADVIAAYPGLTSLGVEREGEWVSLSFRAPA